MRQSFLFLLLCNSLLALVAGFTKDDHEIFRLKDEIVAAEGNGVTFYGKCNGYQSLVIELSNSDAFTRLSWG